MSKLCCEYVKYSGAGNDFIIINHKIKHILDPAACAKKLCQRKVSIGADGLILLEGSPVADYRMRIFNADGSEAEMCGNGLRCLAHYINTHFKHSSSISIETQAGIMSASVTGNSVTIEMGSFFNPHFTSIFIEEKKFELGVIDVGVPHAIYLTEDIKGFPLQRIGRKIRYHKNFMPKGTNFNIASVGKDKINIRTFERGVENETLACGTGCIATALILNYQLNIPSPINLSVASDEILTISFKKATNGYTQVTMTGKACKVHDGKIAILP